LFLIEPEPTPYDLRWTMFGIPIRVHPMFWLFTAILGWSTLQRGFEFLLLWILCVFVSVLVHELGHVFAGRLFGASGQIVLYTFGGLAIGSSDLSRRWQRIGVYFAGPLAGFLLCGVVVLLYFLGDPESYPPLGEAALRYMIIVNLAWGVLNLLPIWPLDGGRISRDALDGLFPQHGARVALGISFVLAAVLAINALAVYAGKTLIPFFPFGGIYMAIMFGLLALGSYQAMQMEAVRRQPWQQDRQPWEQDPDDWKR
jgi:Zn-dependent protease